MVAPADRGPVRPNLHVTDFKRRLSSRKDDTPRLGPPGDKIEKRIMSSLSPRLQVRVQQKQTLTPGLVQMVSLLQLNKLELKEMISAEVAQNPVLEESTDGSEELSPEELQPLLEAERVAEPADQSILDVTAGPPE